MNRRRPASPETLRICLLGYRSAPWVGGQGVYLKHLSQALIEAGHRVDVLSGEPYPELAPDVGLIPLPGMNLYEKGLGSLRWRDLGSLGNIGEWLSKLSGGFAEPWAFCRRAQAWLQRHGHEYDLVHDNQSLGSGLLQIQARGIPLLATIHHPITRDLQIALQYAMDWRHRLLLRRWYSFLGMQRRVARRLARIVTVSECARGDIAAEFGLDPERIEVVHPGIDADVYKPQPGVQPHPSRLVCTASSDQPLKGVRYLLLAYARLLKDFPQLQLVLIGRLPEGGTALKLAQRLGIRDRLRCLRGLSSKEIACQYAAATIVVVPSLYEGFGFPAAEAMACGSAVVTTDGGALPEVVGPAGVRVAAGDASALAQAIAALLPDAQRRQELGEAGRRRVAANFHWGRTAERMNALYRELVEERAETAREPSYV